MSPHPTRRTPLLVVGVAVLAVLGALLASPTAQAEAPGAPLAPVASSGTDARQALTAAQDVLSGDAVPDVAARATSAPRAARAPRAATRWQARVMPPWRCASWRC